MPQGKFSFLDVFEASPWQILFRGDAAGAKALDPQRWRLNLEQDPAIRKRAQGPTPNQEIGGRAVDYMHAVLAGRPDEKEAGDAFLAFLRPLADELFGGEALSSVYYRYYLAGAAAAIRAGEAGGRADLSIAGAKLLRAYAAMLELHRSPAGTGMPCARCPRGAVMEELEEIRILLAEGTHPKLARKKLAGGYEVAQWSLRELARRFDPVPFNQVRLRWPLTFERRADGWLSQMPTMTAYDPCWAVSFVGGRMHELRWTAPNGRHKAEITRSKPPEFLRVGDVLSASYPEVGFRAFIPLPSGPVRSVVDIAGGRRQKHQA